MMAYMPVPEYQRAPTPDHWVLLVEPVGNLVSYEPGRRLDNQLRPLWGRFLAGELAAQEVALPDLSIARHTPSVTFRAPIGMHVELDDMCRDTVTEAAHGLSARQAAKIHGVSEWNINKRLKKVRDQLQASNRVESVAKAVVLGQVATEPDLQSTMVIGGGGLFDAMLLTQGFTERQGAGIRGKTGIRITTMAHYRTRGLPSADNASDVWWLFRLGIYTIGEPYDPAEVFDLKS